MSVFCLLWVPMFYFFRRSISNGRTGMGWWALLLGCAAVLVRYFTGRLIEPVGFGLSCWLSGFIDIVGLPVLVPVVVCVLLIAFRVFPSDVDIGGFTFLWLIPLTFYYSLEGSLLYSPLMLVLVPLLWTTQTLGVSFFIDCIIKYRRWYIIIPSIPAAAVLPLIASSVWWAFYSQQTKIACLFLFASIIPALVSVMVDWGSGRGREQVTMREQSRITNDLGDI